MKNFNKVVGLAIQLVDQAVAYERRATKAETKRMRATINELKKVATAAKADLIEVDKA